ncbi:SGNH/GDSL hydrolase family protein [Sphingomonas immobilis]|uniref:SGNH/GDSL hydrolase family protein n=1 Tax=Sphingomonas immobilis TaxID=3063997 RepID=A0ABT9A0W8_9SPHN|nr:SGNH/GDSL hydrolase family protein [Sphingomonas sp. CA1-15]MDO7843473.1 SGNH/GDSL hydrolase family protein [Sphingomonas sp. CA1-15]
MNLLWRRALQRALLMLMILSIITPASAQNPNITGRPLAAPTKGTEWVDFRQDGQPVTAPVATVISGVNAAAGVTPSRSYLRHVANNVFQNTAISTTLRQVMIKTSHVARGDITAIALLEANFYINNPAFAETGSGSPLTVHASIEYPKNTFTELKWSGNANGTVADGLIGQSDFLTIAIPDGAVFGVRRLITSTTGIMFKGAYFAAQNTFGEGAVGSTTTTPDLVMGGTIDDSTPSPSISHPYGLVGFTKKPVVQAVGDSIAAGAQDSVRTASGDYGFIAQALGAANIPFINTGVASDQAQNYVKSHIGRAAASRYATDIIIQYGVNDFNAGRTAAQLATDISTIASYFYDRRVWLTTITPRATSTDTFATLANQTTHSSNAQRVIYNNMVRNGQIPGVAGYFEVADQVESARDSGLWKVNGAAGYFTADGIHPSTAASLAAATAIQTSRFTVSVAANDNHGGAQVAALRALTSVGGGRSWVAANDVCEVKRPLRLPLCG